MILIEEFIRKKRNLKLRGTELIGWEGDFREYNGGEFRDLGFCYFLVM